MSKPQSPGLFAVGWKEWVMLPELTSKPIKAKVDTGARTSALHAFNIRIEEQDGEDTVLFEIHPYQNDDSRSFEVQAPLADQRDVRSSTGHVTFRPVIITQMEWADQAWPIELTLINRDAMGFRMLLGREAMLNRCVVDPGRAHLGGSRKRPKPATIVEIG